MNRRAWGSARDAVMVSVLTGERVCVFENWNHASAAHYAEFGCFDENGLHRVQRLRHLRRAMPAERRAYLAAWVRNTGRVRHVV